MRLMGMDCWTLRGIFSLSRSLWFAAARDLIMAVTPLSIIGFIIRIFADVLPIPGKQQFGLDDSPNKLLKAQAVVAEKARRREGRCQDDAEPACGFPAYEAPKAQIDASRDEQRGQRAKELPSRQAKEDAFLVLPDLFRDFYFDKCSPSLKFLL